MEKSIIYIKVSAINPDPQNPRRTFNDADLAELAESIKQLGVLQPITVRCVEGSGKYRLVCGERRWRAAQLANLETVPAIIRELTDEEAMDFAITENLQRKDVSPIEEADAFSYLIEKGSTIADLCARFGKSEFYVRGRLKLVAIIPELRELIDTDKMSISQVMELAKFDAEIQLDITKEHWRGDNCYHDWSNLKSKALYEKVVSTYTRDLTKCKFDTSECALCPKCSKNFSLFADTEGSMECADLECLQSKEAELTLQKVLKMLKKYPSANLYVMYFDEKSRRANYIKDEGYTVCTLKDHPRNVDAPMFKNANNLVAAGRISLGILIYEEPRLVYFNTSMAPTSEAEEANLKAIKDLEGKITRELELKGERAIAEVNDHIKDLDFAKLYDTPILPIEEELVMFAMINSLSVDSQRVLAKEAGVKMRSMYGGMEEKDMWDIAQLITSPTAPFEKASRVRAFVFRLTIEDKLLRHSPCLTSDKIFEWVDAHAEGTTAKIQLKHEATYLKRKNRLNERIAALEKEIKSEAEIEQTKYEQSALDGTMTKHEHFMQWLPEIVLRLQQKEIIVSQDLPKEEREHLENARGYISVDSFGILDLHPRMRQRTEEEVRREIIERFTI